MTWNAFVKLVDFHWCIRLLNISRARLYERFEIKSLYHIHSLAYEFACALETKAIPHLEKKMAQMFAKNEDFLHGIQIENLEL